MKKKILIVTTCVALVIMSLYLGILTNNEVDEQINTVDIVEEVEIEEPVVEVTIDHPFYDSTKNTYDKYEILKKLKVLPEGIDETYVVEGDGEALNYALRLRGGNQEPRENTEDEEVTINKFLHDVMFMLDYDVNRENVKEKAQELGVVSDLDVDSPLDYENLVDILYNAVFIPVNYKEVSPQVTSFEIISKYNAGDITGEFLGVDFDGGEPYGQIVPYKGMGDVYLGLDTELIPRLMTVIENLSNYYTVEFNGEIYRVRPQEIVKLTDEVGGEKTLLRVYVKFEVTGNNETYETVQSIFIKRNWVDGTLIPENPHIVRPQLASSVINKTNNQTVAEDIIEEGNIYTVIGVVDEDNNMLKKFRVPYEDGVPTIKVEEIDL